MAHPGGARVLIIGSGGREHALGAMLKRCEAVGTLLSAGGANAGLEAIAERVSSEEAADGAGADLVVIGPEAPLVGGLADRLRAKGRAVFGPSAGAARLEASKAYTKAIAERAGIPTARAMVCHDEKAALAAIDALGGRCVVKADGLAAGKGVTVADDGAAAREAVSAAFLGAFGKAGETVLVEERLEGREVSLFALSDGAVVRPLPTARDYKRAYDGDAGPNTGGMGAVSPGAVDEAVIAQAMRTIVEPAIKTLAADGVPYAGVLYAGLMLTEDGPKLIEFNVRFGDPEAQAILPRLADPFALLHATATGRLAEAAIEVTEEAAVCLVLAAADYPSGRADGEPIGGLDAAAAAGALVFHAGTRREGSAVLADGGRVLNVVALGSDVAAARARAYAAAERIDWPGGRMRRDIGA